MESFRLKLFLKPSYLSEISILVIFLRCLLLTSYSLYIEKIINILQVFVSAKNCTLFLKIVHFAIFLVFVKQKYETLI